MLELIRRRTQNFTIIDQEKHKIEQIYIWNPLTTAFMIDVINMEFLSLRCKRPSWQNVVSSDKQGETAVFEGLKGTIEK